MGRQDINSNPRQSIARELPEEWTKDGEPTNSALQSRDELCDLPFLVPDAASKGGKG